MSNNRTNISDNDFFGHRSRLLYISYSKYENDWKSLKHLHPFSEIFYVIGGIGKFTIENETFDVKTDDMIIVNPNVYHHEDSEGDNPLEYVVLGVGDFSFALDGQNQSFVYQSFEKDNDDIQYYIMNLLIECENKELGYETVCQKLLDLFLLKIIRKMRVSLESSNFQKPIKREIRMICYYIDENYGENITLESLADYMKMNKYYMAHEFKKEMGISPINYLIERRIRECKSLLTTTSLSISEISETVGFSSQSYFSQIFKKATGMTPKKSRDTILEKQPTQPDSFIHNKYTF